jgi:hypothetical protein
VGRDFTPGTKVEEHAGGYFQRWRWIIKKIECLGLLYLALPTLEVEVWAEILLQGPRLKRMLVVYFQRWR